MVCYRHTAREHNSRDFDPCKQSLCFVFISIYYTCSYVYVYSSLFLRDGRLTRTEATDCSSDAGAIVGVFVNNMLNRCPRSGRSKTKLLPLVLNLSVPSFPHPYVSAPFMNDVLGTT